MKEWIDLFSNHSEAYMQFRPQYPESLYRLILGYDVSHALALDCGTGNGQVAKRLARNFEVVEAIDQSQNQLKVAYGLPNVYYSRQRAEKTFFPDESMDLITCAQAIHWMDIDHFFVECQRLLKPDGILAIWGYGLIECDDPDVDARIKSLYGTLGPYWNERRSRVDSSYRNVTSFLMTEVLYDRTLYISVEWNIKRLISYLKTWSAYQTYISESRPDKDPIIDLFKSGRAFGKNPEMTFDFPLFIKIFRPC